MQFDTVRFLAFYAVVFAAYHTLARRHRWQNLLITAASFFFYASWNWRFLFLMLFTMTVDFLVARAMGHTDGARRRKALLTLSVTANLTVLGVFKYFNFFTDSLVVLLNQLGWHVDPPTLRVVLPVGISFYTFQSMAYVIDVYRRELEPEEHPVTFFAFISFFPQLVAGPIERARHLLPQFNTPRTVSPLDLKTGFWLMAYGYFLKTLLANTAALYVDLAFTADAHNGWTTLLGTLAFTLQIYCDFMAYSLIAKGAARWLGFDLMWNFDLPYFASTLQDFWRRWHVSLSTWLRDYLYISLGGNRHGRVKTYRNLLLTMLLGGLWHGAAWNFVAWGLLHGLGLVAFRALRRVLPHPTLGQRVMNRGLTLLTVFVGWFLFRCQSWDMGVAMVRSLGDMSWGPVQQHMLTGLAGLWAPLLMIEWWQYRSGDHLCALSLRPVAFAVLTGALLATAFLMLGRFQFAFIYFQF